MSTDRSKCVLNAPSAGSVYSSVSASSSSYPSWIVIFWFFFFPQEPKFTITNATLTQFNFNSFNNTLNYNLALNMTIRNPNKRVGIYLKSLETIEGRGLLSWLSLLCRSTKATKTPPICIKWLFKGRSWSSLEEKRCPSISRKLLPGFIVYRCSLLFG